MHPKRITLTPNRQLVDYIRDSHDAVLFYSTKEHYTLLSSLSEKYTGQVLYDIGTYKGLSALALSSNQTNRVVSYDIGYFVSIQRPENVEFRIGDFFTDKNLLMSPLIVFDVDPHNGKIERQFLDWLLENSYKGTVVFDDIRLNFEMMQFWTSIVQEKTDHTNIGHWSGTGIVVFS